MELYILDDQLRKVEVFDHFRSMIWTDRWQDIGDLDLTITSDNKSRTLLTPGTMVACNSSNRVMIIDSTSDGKESSGTKTLRVTGSSIEGMMLDRSTIQAYPDSSGAANIWTITNKPADIALEIFNQICRYNANSTADNYPFLATGNLYPADTLPYPNIPITMEIEPRDVFSAIQDICKIYDLGFRITRNYEKSQLFFNVYSGNDRTTKQTNLPAVLFSDSLDNLQDTRVVQSVASEKNVAYVYGKNGTQVVYFNAEDATKVGFRRKILVVKADDIDEPAGAKLNMLLRQRGLVELAKLRPVSVFDGEIPKTNSYIYDVDYSLGDLVEKRNYDGLSTIMRVTEAIHTQDAEGYKVYPTLTINEIITPGSWSSWGYNIDWNAIGEVTWNSQP